MRPAVSTQSLASIDASIAASIALAAICASAIACGPAPQQSTASPPPIPSATQLLVERAADREGVPRSLLDSIGWIDSRLSMHRGSPSLDGSCGLFQLAGNSLARAVQLTGISAETICSDPFSNARGGAAILRAEMDRERAAYPDLRDENLGDWYQAVMRLAGNDDAIIADGYAAQIYRVLRDGLSAIASDGTLIQLAPQSFSTLGRALRGDLTTSQSGDYCPNGACVAFLPAATGNFEVAREGASINYVVIHDMEGSYASAIAHFQDPASVVSAHYLLQSSDGAMTQMVRDADTAYQTGNHAYNIGGIGIEHEGFAAEGNVWYTEAMYQSSAALTRWLTDTLSIPRDRTHIIGHYEVPDASHAGWYGGVNHHSDPCEIWAGDPTWHNNTGCYWNWDHYMALVTGQSSGATNGTLTGFVGDACCGIASGTRKPLAGATVSLSGTTLTATTDATGTYSFSLAPGDYKPIASLNGYITADHSSLGSGYPATLTVSSSATAFASIVLQPSAPAAHIPVIAISAPANNSSATVSPIAVSGTVDDASIATVSIEGNSFATSGGAFSGTAALTAGANNITVSATNSAGTGSATARVTYSPASTGSTGIHGHILGLSAAKLAGAVVTLNPGAETTVSAADGTYSFAIAAGTYNLSVAMPGYQPFAGVAVVPAGKIIQLDLQLTSTTTPAAPSVRIDTPMNGQLFAVPLINVSGYAFVPNLTSVSIANESISFDAATGAFEAQVALAAGQSAITVMATDKNGMSLSATVTVQYVAATASSGGCTETGASSLWMLAAVLVLYIRRSDGSREARREI